MSSIEVLHTIIESMLLSAGELPPLLVVEGTTSCTLIPLSNLPETARERIEAVFQAGAGLAQEQHVGKLKTVCFISRGWFSTVSALPVQSFSPARDPNRKETIVIITLHVEANNQESATWEVVRDAYGGFSRLEPFGVKGQAYSPLLPAFVNGYNTPEQKNARN